MENKKKKRINHPTPLFADHAIASATECTGIGIFWPEGQDEAEEFEGNYNLPLSDDDDGKL